MTNGISVPFKSSRKIEAMIETATKARSAMAFAESAIRSDDEEVRSFCLKRHTGLREKLLYLYGECNDKELNDG